MTETIESPERFFGFRMGTDRKIARWDRIVEYFWLLDKKSDAIKVVELGKSTEGNPFLLAIITSPENMKNLDKIKEMSYRIAHPKGLSDGEIEDIIKNGKTVVEITNSMHATEIGGTQMSPELAYELITSEEPTFQKIRENTVLLLFPCFNPDGEIMITDWYNKLLGTEYEGVNQPWLYHKYVGHDNNRDMIMQHMVETQMWARVTFEEWFPQAYFDHHHMGSYGARLYVPPLSPGWIDVNIDPLVWTEQRLYGGNMADRLEAAGNIGIEYETFVDEFMTTANHVCRRMNMCGMLSESASAKLATPMYIHHQQLQPASTNRPEYNPQTNFPHPWPGGWWSLRDIVDQQKISSLALLEIAAYFKERILRNMYLKATRSIKKGKKESPFAFIIPPYQHDNLTAYKLLKAQRGLGVEIHRAKKNFKAENITYPVGSHIIFLSQIARPYILATLKSTLFKDTYWNRAADGTPIPTKDPATANLAEYMGVNITEVAESFEGDFEELKSIEAPEGSIEAESKHGYILDGRINYSFKAVNRLLKKGIKIYRTDEEVKNREKTFPRGTFYIPENKGVPEALRDEARDLHLTFYPLESTPEFKKHEFKQRRIAMYQRYYAGNMQEGWTRWLLEQHEFSYTTVKDKEIKEGLKDKYDVLILPSDNTVYITGEKIEEYLEERFKGLRPLPNYPPEYRSGIGKEGVEKVKEFVEAGGTLLALNEASNFAIENLKLPVKNVVKDLKPKEFICPGSTLKVNVDTNHPLAYGISKDGLILFIRSSQAFDIKPSEQNEDCKVIVSYPDRLMLQSGWLIGEKYLSRKAALLDVKLGNGNVLLFGFEPLFRAQTHGSFKFFFNAITA